MIVELWLTPHGVKSRAEGTDPGVVGFTVCPQGLDMTEHGYLHVQDLVVSPAQLPSREECIKSAMARLREQETELRERFNASLHLINEARQKMQALEMKP